MFKKSRKSEQVRNNQDDWQRLANDPKFMQSITTAAHVREPAAVSARRTRVSVAAAFAEEMKERKS